MTREEAARQPMQQRARQRSRTTRSIIADSHSFALVMWTLVFVFAVMSVPTLMAASKSLGWW